MNKTIVYIGMTLLVLYSCSTKSPKESIFLKLDSSETGITFNNQLIDSPKLNILTYLYYYNGAGVAAADFNNDGLIDLYFTSNQSKDKLFLNLGNFKFRDITDESKLTHLENWSTGVTHVDINNDGLLDIYVCKVGNYKDFKGRNVLYINTGNDSEGIPIFKEAAKDYGLDYSGLSTQAAFFDYDLDGDLDMFLLNHSVHPNRNYGKGNLRNNVDSISGDRLYSNKNGKFSDVSAEAGIFQGKIGYGLGLGVADLNNDSYPDIYIGNDFFENDYVYINQKDGTFKDLISENEKNLGHTTHYSMGNDIADINNDGLVDILSLDMLPRDLKTYKTSGLEFPFNNYQNYLKNGYQPQFMQNALHLNSGNDFFSEIAHSSGIAASGWSWSGLLADFDNDGFKDIHISTGIKGATNNMDYINFIADATIQREIDAGLTADNMSFIKKIPESKTPNYFFKNKGNLSFEDATSVWFEHENSFSNGSAYADLDNDGNLDLIVNNVNQEAYILQNAAQKYYNNHFLKIAFKGADKNPFAVGAKVIAYLGEQTLVQENFPTRGYLSAVPPEILMGVGSYDTIDSVRIVWPNKQVQTLHSVNSDQKIIANISEAKTEEKLSTAEKKSFISNSDGLIDFKHNDPPTLEFYRNPLVPYVNTNEGPDISIADINNDGLEDIFIGGAKNQPAKLFVQDDNGQFSSIQQDVFSSDLKNENTSHIFFDADNDEDVDLVVVNGGNEFQSGVALKPILYLNDNGKFKKDLHQFMNIEINASKVMAIDFDNDGDLDLTISADQLPHEFGGNASQFLLKNDGHGTFTNVTADLSPEFETLGNVKDFQWTDIDNNGFKDLIAVGHWMPVSIFLNNGKSLHLQKNNGLAQTNGWWNTLEAKDFDNDGDIDLMIGNWGSNSILRASAEEPVTLYRQDFDANGSLETLVTYYNQGIRTPFASKDELVKQMPFLNKKYLSYSKFADASLNELFSKEKLEKGDQKNAYILKSAYFENKGNNTYSYKPLSNLAQISTVQDIEVYDFNDDGYHDVLIAGNSYEISTQLGRLDALHGLILLNDTQGNFSAVPNQKFDISGPARKIERITVKNSEKFVVTINNGKPVFLDINGH